MRLPFRAENSYDGRSRYTGKTSVPLYVVSVTKPMKTRASLAVWYVHRDTWIIDIFIGLFVF